MLDVSVPHHHIDISMHVVADMAAVGKDVTIQHLLRNAFKMFQIVNGLSQKILVISKHFNLEVLLTQLYKF